MNWKILFIGLIIIGLGFSACQKEPGEGGTTTLMGQIYVMDYYQTGFLKAEYFAQEEKVYIMYGEDKLYFDDVVRTHHDGTYQFDYLYPGKYVLYAYSDCSSCPSEQEIVSDTIEITASERGDTVWVPMMTIIK